MSGILDPRIPPFRSSAKKVTEIKVNLKEKDDMIIDLVKKFKIVEDGQNALGKETDEDDWKMTIGVNLNLC